MWFRFEHVEHEVAFLTGGQLTGYNIKKKEDHWLVILKIERRGQSLVAFVDCHAWDEVFNYPLQCIAHNIVHWHADRFASGPSKPKKNS